ALAILASAERTFERPEVATYLLLAVTILLAMRGGKSRRFYISIAIWHALWANLHALAFLGTLALALLAGASALSARHASFALGVQGSRSPKTLLTAAGISALALLANPYGIAAWTFPRTLFRRISGEENVFARILEFASPLRDAADPALRFFWILLALFIMAIAWKAAVTRTGRATLGPVLCVLPFLALALLARRNIPLFAIAAAPLFAFQLSEIAGHLPRRLHPLWPRVPAIAAGAIAIAVLAGVSPSLFGLWRDRGLGVEPGLFPERALQSLDESGNRGPLFNDLDFGGYVAWRNSDRQPWIDGRLEVAGPERLATYLDAHSNPAVWNRLQSSWRFQALLLEHSSPGNAAFMRALLESGQWQLQHLSAEAALLLPNGGASGAPHPTREDWTRIFQQERGPEPHAGHALHFAAAPIDALLRGVQRSPRNAPVRAACRLANACLTLGWIDDARSGYRLALERSPHDSEALFNLGLCELRSGNRDAAHDIWRKALPLVRHADRPRFEQALSSS
ncbi:MAG TPA: hypothetical protein VFR10_00715, partial [bacterium]|nr:hypothetical protein [bacterium]